jgi:hypothetical protein
MPTQKTPRKTARKTNPVADYILPPGKALVLRTCKADMSSNSEYANGFRWPKSGLVKCDDWQPTKECGHGLHGLLWGEGAGNLLNWDVDAVWLIVEIDPTTAIDLDGKIKFPSGVVVYCGTRETAPKWLSEHGGAGRAIASGTATAGYSGTATAGYGGTATAGDSGTATAGDSGTATAGYGGTATAGYGGTATAGDSGTATAGDSGTATAGYGGTAKTGEIGIIVCRWWDVNKERYRLAVGEDGIKANTFYRANESGKLVEVPNAARGHGENALASVLVFTKERAR